MPIGTNPGIYIDIVPLEFTPDTSNDSTHSLFVGFSRRGPDNKLIRLNSAKKLVQVLGMPKKSMYSQQIFNAYNHCIISGNTKFLRLLPNIEDISDPGTELYNSTYPSPATFSNVNFIVFDSDSNIMPKFSLPVNFVPDFFKNPQTYNDTVNANNIPKLVETLYKYEGDNSQDIASTIGNPTSISKSTTLRIYYKDEPTDITIAGTISNNQEISIKYDSFLEATSSYLTNIPDNVKEYINSFLKSAKINYSIPAGNIRIAKGSISGIVPSDGQILVEDTNADLAYTYLVFTFAYNTTGIATDYRLYALSYSDLVSGKIVLPSTENGRNYIVMPLPHNKIKQLAKYEYKDIPFGSNYMVLTTAGIDYNRVNHTAIPTDTGLRITNINNLPLFVIYQKDETPYYLSKNYNIKNVVLPVRTDEVNTNVIAQYKFLIDKMAEDFGWYVLPFIDNYAAVNDSEKTTVLSSDGNCSIEINKEQPSTMFVRFMYIQAVDTLAQVKGKILFSILAEGRGGWYNNLAIEIKPKSTETSTGSILPNPREYTLHTKTYVNALKSYVGVGTSVEFSIYPDDVDETGNSTFIEKVVNEYTDYLISFTNDELIKELKDQPSTDNRFENYYEQMIYYMAKSLTSEIRLNGGCDGCLRNRRDCSINWKQANSMLVQAFNGLYDQSIYDTDNIRVELVFDADYANPVKKAMINYCELRKDCIALLDSPKKPSVDLLTDWFDNSFSTRSYYAAVFAPHVNVYDPFEKDYVWMAPSYALSYLIPYNDITYGFYQPASGFERGVIKHDVKKFGINIALTELSGDQQQTYTRYINLIGKKKGVNLVWGNYTCTSGKNNAMTSLHVMRIMTRLVWEFRSLSSNIWDLMTPSTLNVIRSKAIGILNEYLGTAIENFDVQLQVSEYDRQRRTVRIEIMIKPFLEIRRIYIKFTVA